MLDAESYPKIQTFEKQQSQKHKKIRKTMICSTDFKKVL